MWAIRALSGPQKGQIFMLQPGANKIGRGPNCQVHLGNSGISKEHAQILVTEDKLFISDLNSRNGTLVNGVRVQNQRINPGDKVMLFDVILDILDIPNALAFPQPHQGSQRSAHGITDPRLQADASSAPIGISSSSDPSWGNAAPNLQSQWTPSPHLEPGVDAPSATRPKDFSEVLLNARNNFMQYLDAVALPGIYKLAQRMDYRWVIGVFIAIYITLVTLLSTMPMNALLRRSIEAESARRALTIARGLAQFNTQSIRDNMEVAVNTRPAEIEDGVSKAVILSSRDGHVIAPANMREQDLDLAFYREARHENHELVKSIGGTKVGASVPITYFDGTQGVQVTGAQAIIIYDMAAVGINTDQIFSIFIENLAISALFGFLLLLIMIRVIEHPIQDLNEQLDHALSEGRDDLKTPYQFRALQNFASNINSALTRIAGARPENTQSQVSHSQREAEAEMLVASLDCAAIAINAVDSNIIDANEKFSHLVGGNANLRGASLNAILDKSLVQMLLEMVPNMQANPSQKEMVNLTFSGQPFEIVGQALLGATEPAYYLIMIKKEAEAGG